MCPGGSLACPALSGEHMRRRRTRPRRRARDDALDQNPGPIFTPTPPGVNGPGETEEKRDGRGLGARGGLTWGGLGALCKVSGWSLFAVFCLFWARMRHTGGTSHAGRKSRQTVF